MENTENLAQLESAVDKLLNAIHEMQQDKLVLTARLEGRDQEIENLKQQLQVLQGERSQIEQRVSSLLGSIDEWEKLNESPAGTGKSDTVVGKTLF